MGNNQVADSNQHQINDVISETPSQSDFNYQNSKDIKQIPKKNLHPIVFFLNIAWMLLSCYSILFIVYGSSKQREEKGKLAIGTLTLTIVVGLPTFFYLASIKNILKLAFLLDTIMAVTIAAMIAFINLILLFDTTDAWYWSVIEAGFTIEVFFYSTMLRVMLMHMKWSKWQLLVFKLHTFLNCIMFMVCGVYFIWVDFSYTNHMIVSFDNKVHEFMVLFIFTMSQFTYRLYSKITDLDHTGDLKYTYIVKNFDENLPKRKQSILKQKRDSINNIKILQKVAQFGLGFQPPIKVSKKLSKFANIQSVI